jgi:hypothetical protein
MEKELACYLQVVQGPGRSSFVANERLLAERHTHELMNVYRRLILDLGLVVSVSALAVSDCQHRRIGNAKVGPDI